MKKKIIIITAIVAVAGAGAGGFLFWDNAYQLNGEKSTGKEGYYADFDLFNGKDEFELQLEQGEKLHVDAEIEKGKAEITFGLKDADVCERISDIESVDTVFTADESGRYEITVKAKHAKGKIELKLDEQVKDKTIYVTE